MTDERRSNETPLSLRCRRPSSVTDTARTLAALPLVETLLALLLSLCHVEELSDLGRRWEAPAAA